MPGRRNISRSVTWRPRQALTNRISSANNELFNSADLSYLAANEGDSSPDQSLLDPPVLPTMSRLTFETLLMFYLLTATFVQYVYIFKTVWWYPSTLPPSSSTINFHLIDKNLMTFLVFLFSQRFLWTLLWKGLRPSPENFLYTTFWVVLCLIVFGLWLMKLFSYALMLVERIKIYKILFLIYPIFLWIPFNLFVEEGYLKSFFSLFRKKSAKQRCQVSSPKLMSLSSTNRDIKKELEPEQIRDEVKQLCKDFNSRFAEIMFYSITYSYYGGLVPMLFTKPHHSYNLLWSLQHTGLILVNSFIMLASYLLPSQYLQTLSKSAMLLGGYERVDDLPETKITVQDWSSATVFQCGAYVKHRNKIYKACGKRNTAVPDDRTHSKFFTLFYRPLRMINWQLGALLIVIVYQINMVIFSSHWDHVIAPAILQFFSYYILRTILRDRIVLSTFFDLHENSH